MKKMITLAALIAVLAMMSTGCSELNNPTAPETVSAIDFPQEGNGGGEEAAQAVAPTDLEAKKIGSSVALSWRHSSAAAHWFRVYRAEDSSRYELIQTTQGLQFEDRPAAGYDKLKYRVTAVNAQGIESPFSDAAAVYGGDKDVPNEEIGQDDMDEREAYVKTQSVESDASEDDDGKGEDLPNEDNGQDDMDDWN